MEYKAPENGLPFSAEGLLDLGNQCLLAAKKEDSALLEMAGLALERVAHSRLASESANSCSRLLSTLTRAEEELEHGQFSYKELEGAAKQFSEFAQRLLDTDLAAS